MAELVKAGLVKAGLVKAGLDEQVIAGVTELLPVFRQRAQEAEDGRWSTGRRSARTGTASSPARWAWGTW